ncbi:MAG: VCBS repeat-containing protein [Desulfobacterales bacterium]|nr:VCBS repeat-containing protein [Deltaproteobacteria bacterium]NNL78691.1 VCBS repeat-containing protein [Desulfobacterales bacterium]
MATVADLNLDGSPEVIFTTYGAPAAPTVADLDGDGQLEIFVQTFDHGMDVFTVPGSGPNCLLWSTARGGPRRMGQPNDNDL